MNILFSRLTVPYLYALGIVEVSMKWFHYNSVFEPPTNDHVNCPNYWWRNVLYINTLFPVNQMVRKKLLHVKLIFYEKLNPEYVLCFLQSPKTSEYRFCTTSEKLDIFGPPY